MKNFEFLSNLTVGQYLPTGSPIHRLDPRVKLLSVSFTMMTLIACSNPAGLIAALVLIIAAHILARIPVPYALKGLKPAIPIFVFIAFLQIIAIPQNDGGRILYKLGIVTLTTRDLLAACAAVIRLIGLILIVSLFSFSTSTRELTHGTELLFAPLKRIGFPAHEIAMISTIALRFLPTLIDEADRVRKVQVSRGLDLEGSLIKKIKGLVPLILPLILSSIRKAEELALAMEARCYTENRTGPQFSIRIRDWIALAAAAGFCCLVFMAEFVM